MNTLVVGGAGFIGSHLVDRLLAEGHRVDVVDHLGNGSLANLAEARSLGTGELKIHTLDAAAPEFESVVAMREPAVIYHLGFLPPGDPAELTGAASLASLWSVLEAARRQADVKVVVMLSAAAYYGEVPAKEQPVKESATGSMVGVEGALARAAVDLLTAYRDTHAVEFTVLASGSVYGPRQRPEGGVVAAFVQAVREDLAPVVHGDGRQTRDFVFIDDAVDALVRAATRGNGLVVNVGTGVGTPVRDLWALIDAGRGRTPSVAPRRSGDVTRCALSSTRARIHLAWSPWTTLADGVGQTLAGR
jgi:UDP-glucose 4-epimerase